MVQPANGPASVLAERLRALRKQHWPDASITQKQLAEALSARKPVSVPAVSSWESPTSPVIPSAERLGAYATLFATRRSIEGAAVRLLDDAELTEDEQIHRKELLRELLALRTAAAPRPLDQAAHYAPAAPVLDVAANPWHFPDQRPITIVCAPLPASYLARMPYTDPDRPDYIEAYAYADLDALLELHGHIRATNPQSQVQFRLASALESDDYTTHLVLLGGVDWNLLTRDLLKRLDVPVSQVTRDTDADGGYFEVADGIHAERFAPVMAHVDGKPALLEDVAHFFRDRNPFNRKRTLTICNGMFGRGVMGAVRALTDERFRDRNAEFIKTTFAGGGPYSILARVPIVTGKALTPDWTLADTRLHVWPEMNE
jgi:transcriptional regulator with XRE-family HTH domain